MFSGLKFEQNQGLFYKVGRAIFRKTQKQLSNQTFAELAKFSKMKQEDKDKFFKPSQQSKLAYMLELGERNLEEVDWTKFNSSYVMNLMKDYPEDSPHQRLSNLWLAARFASFLYWTAGKNKSWLECLSQIDKLGQKISSWVPIDIYLHQYYSNIDSGTLGFNLLIPSIPCRLHPLNAPSQLLPFYKKRLIDAYSEDEKIRQRFPTLFPSRMMEKDIEAAKNKRLFDFSCSKYTEGDLSYANDLGYCYEMGWGTQLNLPMAFSLYKTAAEAGIAFGTCNLAHCYQEGRGTDSNPGEAQRLFAEVDPETLKNWKKARGL